MNRIGLTQRVEEVPEYGEQRDCLDQQWASLVISLGCCPVPLANSVQDVHSYVTMLQLDGVILTGGNDLCEGSMRDQFEHTLLDVCAKTRLPVLGVCRGLQIMGVHYGGRITPVSHHVKRRHAVSLAPGLFDGWPQEIEVNSFHQFGIGESEGSLKLRAIAWAEDGTIEAVAHETLPQFAVMWHPERERPFMNHDLVMIRAIFRGESI